MNKEITIYELLGLIKDGQAPKKIKFSEETFVLKDGRYKEIHNTNQDNAMLGDYFRLDGMLNDKVEIIEEDNKTEYENVEEINYVGCKVEINIIGIKELFNTDSPVVTEHCIDKINQLIRNQKKLIDEVNKLKENNND